MAHSICQNKNEKKKLEEKLIVKLNSLLLYKIYLNILMYRCAGSDAQQAHPPRSITTKSQLTHVIIHLRKVLSNQKKLNIKLN